MIYDIILTGYGAAGLSMLHHLMQHPNWENKSILIIDELKYTRIRKTWCFWDNKSTEYKCAKKFYWKELEVIGNKEKVHNSLRDNIYYHINSEDLYQEVNDKASYFNNIQFILSKVLDITDKGSLVEVDTGETIFKSKYVINSIQGLGTNEKVTLNFNQNFLGWRIETNEPVFNKNVATLMDFRNTSEPAAFYYVLPYSETYALVEFTRFSREVKRPNYYEHHLHNYITNSLKASSYKIVDKEFGVIPMTDYPYKKKLSKRIFQLGTVGGNTKSTTGYTFKNIQKRCKSILTEIDTSISKSNVKKRFGFYDRLLLNILAKKPKLTEKIMFSLFENNRFDTIFKFLDEETSLIEEMKIFKGMPWAPFVKMLFARKEALYETSTKSTNNHIERYAVSTNRS